MARGPFEGELIRLRAHEPEEVDRTFTWLNDPEVRQFLGRQYHDIVVMGLLRGELR